MAENDSILEQKENAEQLLCYMQKGHWYKADGLCGFAFDMANLCVGLCRLNKQLIERKLGEPIMFPEEFLAEARSLFNSDDSYDFNYSQFKKLVPIKLIEVNLPNWF